MGPQSNSEREAMSTVALPIAFLRFMLKQDVGSEYRELNDRSFSIFIFVFNLFFVYVFPFDVFVRIFFMLR